jgi:hypothetical protein
VDGACSTQKEKREERKERRELHATFLYENLKGHGEGDLSVDGRILLEWMLKE